MSNTVVAICLSCGSKLDERELKFGTSLPDKIMCSDEGYNSKKVKWRVKK